MYFDYHMHSDFSADSQSSMEDMILRSIDLGVKEICFTDHVDYDVETDECIQINYNEYFKALNYYREKYQDKITIKKGIEMGLQNHIINTCSSDVLNNPFDFVICSVHAINKVDLYYGKIFENLSQHQAYEKYYTELYNIVKNYKDYSVLGHLDLIKRYGDFNSVIDDKLFYDIIEAILKQAIHDGKGIEVNTSCYRYNLPDLTPSRNILKMYKELGGEIITTGSDSHMPSQVAYQFDYIYEYLKDIGFKYVSSFENMKPKFNKL